MAERKFYWLKLKRDFFKRHDIRIIEEMPNGKDYILFYLKMLLESIDHEGELRFSEAIPYNEQMLAVITNTNIDIVKAAMQIFIELNMIEILDNNTIYMAEVQKLIGSETKWAEYKRNKKVNELPPLKVCKRLSYESIQLPNGKVQYVDEKRYGCNGGLAFDRAGGKCEVCGSDTNLVIHHNNGYSNELEDLLICCKKCHAKLEKFQSDSKLLPTEIEIDIEKEKKKDINIISTEKPKPKRKKFVPPTFEEVETYCRERNNNVDAKRFYDYYTASDWYDGKGNKVKSWKQKVITWERDSAKPKATYGYTPDDGSDLPY